MEIAYAAAFIALVAAGYWAFSLVMGKMQKPVLDLNWKPRERPLMALPIHKGKTYDTECTCATQVAGRVKRRGKWVWVCRHCGSLRR